MVLNDRTRVISNIELISEKWPISGLFRQPQASEYKKIFPTDRRFPGSPLPGSFNHLREDFCSKFVQDIGREQTEKDFPPAMMKVKKFFYLFFVFPIFIPLCFYCWAFLSICYFSGRIR